MLANGAEPARLAALAERLRAAYDESSGSAGGQEAFLRLSDVVEREIAWYWPGRLAWGNVAVIAGDGGVGKSTLAQELGARMTRGQAPPGGEPGEPRGVLILSAEEDVRAVVRPRMRLMGADLARVTALDPDRAGLTLPSGAQALEERCRGDSAGLLVIDTGPAFLDAGLKSNSEEDVRRFLAPLRAIAERLELVALVLAHLNKDSSRTAGQRIMGGAAWRNAPRQVLMVGAPAGQDPRESPERLVAVEKNNLGAYPAAVSFRLSPAPDDPSRAVVGWGGEVEGVHPSDLVGDPPTADERSDREQAREFLREELAEGRRPVPELRRAAEAASLAWRTVERAKKDLGVASTRDRFGAEGGWSWSLPGAPAKAARQDPASEGRHGGGLSEMPDRNGDSDDSTPVSPPSPPGVAGGGLRGGQEVLAVAEDWSVALERGGREAP